jgi:DNA-binding transcriptional ArsR family regulator
MAEAREIKDPKALRALAHPGRLKLLEELALIGPATATQLSERVGESPANCSWHLRQLARYGFVEEAGGGSGRQRPWRLVPGPRSPGEHDGVESGVIGDTIVELLVDQEVAALTRWQRDRAHDDPQWRDAAGMCRSLVWLTAEELGDLNEQITELFTRYCDRTEPGDRPPGARPVRLMAWGIPAGPHAGQPDA